jgi:hypothetical protein
MDDMDVAETRIIESKDNEYLKLTKNTRGYNFEIKIVNTSKLTDSAMVDRLKALNERMMTEFGPGIEADV